MKNDRVNQIPGYLNNESVSFYSFVFSHNMRFVGPFGEVCGTFW